MGYNLNKTVTMKDDFKSRPDADYWLEKSKFFYSNNNRLYGDYLFDKLGTINCEEHIIVKRRLDETSEVSEMIFKLNKLFKMQIKFLIEGFALVLASFIGLVLFYKTGRYILNPILYVVTLIMGLGWGLTALHSIKSNKDDMGNV
jgi:hypothetical protein